MLTTQIRSWTTNNGTTLKPSEISAGMEVNIAGVYHRVKKVVTKDVHKRINGAVNTVRRVKLVVEMPEANAKECDRRNNIDRVRSIPVSPNEELSVRAKPDIQPLLLQLLATSVLEGVLCGK